jgi:predicted enzyme related to lactoylglutathione lyase
LGLIPVVPADAIRPTEDEGAPAGCIAWLDLTVADASATRDFYRQVVGWSVKDVPLKDANESYSDYEMLGGDGRLAASVCHARGVNLGLPPVWLIHLPVRDLAESVRRVRDEGGKVIKTTTGGDGELACAVIQDPVGAHLALLPG